MTIYEMLGGYPTPTTRGKDILDSPYVFTATKTIR